MTLAAMLHPPSLGGLLEFLNLRAAVSDNKTDKGIRAGRDLVSAAQHNRREDLACHQRGHHQATTELQTHVGRRLLEE